MADEEEFYTPVPAGTSRLFSPPEALQEIAELVDPKYRMYFLSGNRQLMEGEFVSAEDRVLIASLRNEILSGGDVERVFDNINRFLARGETFQLARGQVSAVLSGTRYVRPTEDPLGRTGEETGFGRGGGQIPTETAPELATGAEDIEPGELSRQPSPYADPYGRPTEGLGFGRGVEEPAAEGAAPSEGGIGAGVISDVADTEADSNIPEDWRETAREMYPNYYAIVRNIPEIAALLERAVAQTYTPEQFQAQLEQTNWFLQTSGSAREWEINSNRDPASAQRLIDEKRVSIRDTALATFGVRLSEERLTQLATDSLRFGWSDRFLQNAIGDVATTSTAGITQLREGYIGQQLRETANNYGIAVSDATFNQWVNKVAVGQESTASWEDYAKVQAKNLFPSIADRIDAGENFQQIVDPYRQSAAALLEIDGGDIDFTQPDWIKAITQMDDKGNQRQMSFTEWNDYVRQNRSFGYEYTEQAQRRAYQVANRLADLFGKV